MTPPADRSLARRRLAGRIIGVALVAVALALGALVLHRLDTRPRTDDAVVTDPEPYELRLRQARAQMHSLENQIALGSRTVASQQTGASVAQTNIEAARAHLEAASDSLTRLEPLAAKGYVTAEQLELARTNKLTAEVGLKQAIQSAQQARQLVGDTLAIESQLEGARALVAIAERDLRRRKRRLGRRVRRRSDHVGTYTDAVDAQTARVQAHAAREQAYAEVLTAAAALAFASGGLTSAHALGR